jgi:1-acyl-sn-glycerol-3-phosphate acyltransferase
MKTKSGKRRSRKKIKTPNGVIYFILYIILYPLLKILFTLKVDRSEYKPPKGASIFVCNHQSFMDFLLAMLAVYPRRLNAVTAQKFFFTKQLNVFLPVMGCIPKNLFEPDARSVMGVISVIKRGRKLILFPEGRSSTDGTYAGIHKATGKLVKKLGVPVISVNIEGSYICMPFWRKGFRRGQLRVTISNLLTSEDTKSLTVDEINTSIDDRLSKADTVPTKEQFKVFKTKRLAEGLENIIYYCPKCNQEFTFKSNNNTISCTVCNNTASMNRYSRLIPEEGSVIPETIQEWYKIQVMHEMQSISVDMEPIKIRVSAKVSSAISKGVFTQDRGVLSLDNKGWNYDGYINGEKIELFFPIDSVPAIPFDPHDNFQIYANGKYFAFTPFDNLQACTNYAILGECIYHRFASEIQMTAKLTGQ